MTPSETNSEKNIFYDENIFLPLKVIGIRNLISPISFPMVSGLKSGWTTQSEVARVSRFGSLVFK
jgi:hypothetical protein